MGSAAVTDDDRVEILAQAMWMGQHGTIVITPRWQEWSSQNKKDADALRDKARDMIGAAKGQTHHSLGWIP